MPKNLHMILAAFFGLLAPSTAGCTKMVSNLDYPSGRIRGYIAESGRNICSIDQVSKAGNYFNCITGYQANFGSSGSYNILFFYEPAGVSTLPTSLKTFYNAAGKASRKDINGQWFCAGSVGPPVN